MIADALRQSRAAAVLLFRYLARRPVRGGAGPTYAKTRAPWFVLLSALWTSYVGTLVWQRFNSSALALDGLPAMGWQLAGVVLALVGFGMVELAPEMGRIRPPLRIALLEELPFSTAARVFLVWFRNPFLPALAILGALAWSPNGRSDVGGVVAIVALALALYLAAMTLGYAFGSWVRVFASGRGRRVINLASLVLVLLGMQILIFSDQLHEAVWPPGAFIDASRALRDGHVIGPLFWVAIALLILGLVAIGVAERMGYDRLDAHSAKVRRGKHVELDLHATERLLTRREGGVGLAFVAWFWFTAVVVGSVFALVRGMPSELVPKLTLAFAVLAAYLGAIIALSRAGQAVRRDAGARAFLAPLPIAPYQTLIGKVQAIRRLLIPLMLALVPPIVVAVASGDRAVALEVSWRAVATAFVIWVGCDAAVSIAFLTGGVGLPGARNLGAPTSFAVQIMVIPILAAAGAANALVAFSVCITVWAVAFEARRAAHFAVRWLDDAADDLARDTTVWRALLALAAFYAVQALGFQLFSLAELGTGVTMALTLAGAGVVLVILTAQGRRGLPPLRILPENLGALLLGPLAGAVSALAAIGFAWLVQGAGVELQQDRELTLLDIAAFGFASIVIAPIVEEVFFRGWLQTAIAHELPDHRKKWAFALAALAFALAHVGGVIVPQLVMGLFAGLIYARWNALLPVILAHATHNALVLVLAGQFLGSQ